MGLWMEIKPKVRRRHSWHFARYVEPPSLRDDGQWYELFLFRDDERSRFGKQQFRGRTISRRNFQKMAERVVLDEAFRRTLLSDDAVLPKLWKRH